MIIPFRYFLTVDKRCVPLTTIHLLSYRFNYEKEVKYEKFISYFHSLLLCTYNNGIKRGHEECITSTLIFFSLLS